MDYGAQARVDCSFFRARVKIAFYKVMWHSERDVVEEMWHNTQLG